MGTGFLTELSLQFANLSGDRSSTTETKLMAFKNEAIWSLKKTAVGLGADAIICVHMEYFTLNANTLVLVVSGTPVILEDMKNDSK